MTKMKFYFLFSNEFILEILLQNLSTGFSYKKLILTVFKHYYKVYF